MDDVLLELMKKNISDLVHDVLKDEPGLIIIKMFILLIKNYVIACMCLLYALDCLEIDAECMSVCFGWISCNNSTGPPRFVCTCMISVNISCIALASLEMFTAIS